MRTAIGENGKRVASTVYEAPKGDGNVNNALARMLGEDN